MTSANVRRPRRPAATAIVFAVVAALVGLTVTSCTGVPDRSPARVADPMPVDARPPERPTLPFVVVRPERGDSPRDIVTKYLQAQANPERSHGLARQFLTPHAAETWDDNASSRVIDPSPYIRSASPDNEVRVDGNQLGSVTANGSYTSNAGPYSYDFELVKVSGEWRIGNPPVGVIVTSNDFKNIYRQYFIYYLDPAGRRVIPDPRYFAATSTSSVTSRATTFVRLLQQAPSAALATAVRSELVEGVRLAGNVRQGNDKVLRVYLTGLGAKASAARNAAAAQIVWTLSPLAASGIEIFDDDQKLDLQGVRDRTQQSDWQSFDPDAMPVSTSAYFLRDGAVYNMDGTRTQGPAGSGQYRLRSLAVSLPTDAEQRIAGVSTAGGRARLYVGQLGGPLESKLESASLTSPTWDSAADEVWTVRDGNLIVRVPRRGEPTKVDSSSLDELGPIRALRLSRDATRVAIIAKNPGQLYVGRVTRDNGQIAVEAPVLVNKSLNDVSDVAWSSATSLFVLASGLDRDPVLRTVTVDGAQVTSVTKVGLPGPPNAIAAAPNLASIVESEGSLWQRTGERWTNLVRGSNVVGKTPVYPD